MIKIATWNVNSIRARLENTVQWLREAAPDVVLLQELKCTTDNFPYNEIEDCGYNIAAHGQKTYNGVAILSKFPIDDIIYGLPGDDGDEARYIEAVICADVAGDNAGGADSNSNSNTSSVYRVASVYVPNGTKVDSPRFEYKLKFFDVMQAHLKTLLEYEENVIIGGDYNVAPADIDVYDADRLRDTLCFHYKEQAKFQALLNLGYSEAFRMFNPEKQQFSWWDYRAKGYADNKGMRIDHFLLSPQAADIATGCVVDEVPRAKEKPSDHTPVILQI